MRICLSVCLPLYLQLATCLSPCTYLLPSCFLSLVLALSSCWSAYIHTYIYTGLPVSLSIHIYIHVCLLINWNTMLITLSTSAIWSLEISQKTRSKQHFVRVWICVNCLVVWFPCTCSFMVYPYSVTLWYDFKRFFSRLLSPDVSQGASDYYVVMLFFDTLCLLTIVFGVSSFGVSTVQWYTHIKHFRTWYFNIWKHKRSFRSTCIYVPKFGLEHILDSLRTLTFLLQALIKDSIKSHTENWSFPTQLMLQYWSCRWRYWGVVTTKNTKFFMCTCIFAELPWNDTIPFCTMYIFVLIQLTSNCWLPNIVMSQRVGILILVNVAISNV